MVLSQSLHALYLIISLILFSSIVFAQTAAEDKITSLPFINTRIIGQYSGYLNVDSKFMYHYWLVEAENNPDRAPLVLWLNGGPGCSSLDGYWYEHGPFHFAAGNELKVIENPWRWNKVANILYLESPFGVGFSYSDKISNYTYSDPLTAELNYKAIKAFFIRFPQYKNNKFWITGESYAGIYIPMTARLVVLGKEMEDNRINFQGVMVGNGVTNGKSETTLNVQIEFMKNHNIITPSDYKRIMLSCQNLYSYLCYSELNAANRKMNDIDIYDIYGDCFHQRNSIGSSIPCISSTLGHKYLNMPETKKAIHVNTSITWNICNDIINSRYQRTSDSMVSIYQQLLSKGHHVLIYSGDTDFAVPITGTLLWTYNDMGLIPINGRDWTQWYYNDDKGKQVGGFVTEFATTKGRFTFCSVRGSGHMVPQLRPQQAYVMFTNFLNDEPL